MIKIKRKTKRKTKRYLVILGLAAVIIILVIAIVRGVGGLIRPSVDTSADWNIFRNRRQEMLRKSRVK